MNSTPTVRRTKRHVIIRLTPDEAVSAFWMAKTSSAEQMPVRASSARHRAVKKLEAAYRAADQTPDPKPNRTSFGNRPHQPEYP